MRFEADEITLTGGIRHGRTLGSPVAIEIANSEWPKWTEEMSPAPGPTGQGSHPAPPGPCRPGRACRSTASTTPGTSSSGPPPGRRRPAWRPGPGQAAPVAARGEDREPRCADWGRRHAAGQSAAGPRRPGPRGRERGALLRPATAEADDRRRQGGRQGGRLARWRRRGVRLRGAGGAGQPRALGPQARWPAGPGPHEHPGRQGRRDRRRVGQWPAGAAPSRTMPSRTTTLAGLRASHGPRRWDRGRYLERRPAGGPGGHEAAGHPQPSRARDGRRGDEGVDGQLPASAPTSRRCPPWGSWRRP